ncbi:hypothetical protein AVEN_62402-1 [Araneus ventricosus]|uniref:Uncharacterized protein n=1 Tax=Araneus ventricosus TaxID=182803 RepID=A0A4Y2IRT5_ARAVE|nr:hypothetical protein AVEN_62402-1 [Araneus ventricosus]
MQVLKCNPNEIGGLLGVFQENRRQSPAEVLRWKIGIHRDFKLSFKYHKCKISYSFPDNEAARSFVTWALHGMSDVLKYAGYPSDDRSSHEDASLKNASTTSDKLQDKQRCRNDKPIMRSPQTCKTVSGENQAPS